MARSELDMQRVGFSLGLLFAVMHGAKLLVLGAAGDGLIKWAMGIHFISIQYQVLPFNWGTWLVGTATAFVAGAVIGSLFAWIWNRFK